MVSSSRPTEHDGFDYYSYMFDESSGPQRLMLRFRQPGRPLRGRSLGCLPPAPGFIKLLCRHIVWWRRSGPLEVQFLRSLWKHEAALCRTSGPQHVMAACETELSSFGISAFISGSSCNRRRKLLEPAFAGADLRIRER